ncbi:hypothetical protein F3Y22_tig00117056pilonHSYRG00322 [Hibiscus syriacus]|uniref:Uncharacterized protein n=1 Tax=Hibiscus syriacus TaxID=106335 RepID=A0A6A2WKZ4_HIBSY|nr:hypothetical protein F3Y22_tig00117056pilonHSYRG00322 [Hibiscus syriacus]
MASSLENNLGSIESWAFRPSFTDSWLSEAFSRDTEALTKALQDSISNTDCLSFPRSSPLLTPTLYLRPPVRTFPVPIMKPCLNAEGAAGDRGQICNAQMSPGPILKPEPQRPGSLPTLDTSAFLLDHRQPCSGGVAGSGVVPLQSSVWPTLELPQIATVFLFFPL